MFTVETWSRLTEAEQITCWRAFIASLDAGDAGYDPWYPVLAPLWSRGETPHSEPGRKIGRRARAGGRVAAPQPLSAELYGALGEPPY